MVLLMASCSEDYKDWAEPQSNPQTTDVKFSNGNATSAGLINLAEMPATATTVKVCEMTVPSSTDPTYTAECYIVLDGEEFPITQEGMMDMSTFSDYVVAHFGRDSVVNEIPARVIWVMTNKYDEQFSERYTSTTLTSEAFTMQVIPPPLMIPDLWYLAGNCIGNCRGLTQIGEEHVGSSLIPMYATPGKLSQLTYVGFFQKTQRFDGRFFILHHPGDKSEQWGTNADGEIALNGTNPITIPEAGYYRINLDTDHSVLTITKLDNFTPTVYSSINLPGEYQGWKEAENPMSAVGTMFENHDWIVKDLTFAQATELKFAANGSWDVNWGGIQFPVGVGIMNDQQNIPVAAGTYTLFFNDILGSYYFMEQE